jgi:hypothetical protein
MKSFMPKLLFFYSAIASLLITVSLVLTSNTFGPVIFATLFLPVTAYFIIEFFKQMHTIVLPKSEKAPVPTPKPKKGEAIVFILIFILLVGLGINNIRVTSKANSNPDSSTPQASSSPFIFKTGQTSTPAASLTVSITDGSPTINIRQKPTTYSEKIGTAKDGDKFTYVDKVDGWYQINLATGSGYVSSKYVKEIEQ